METDLMVHKLTDVVVPGCNFQLHHVTIGTVCRTDRFATNVGSSSCLMGVNLVNTFNMKFPDDNVRNRPIHHPFSTIWTIIQKSRIKNRCMILLIYPSPIMHNNCTAACLQHLDLVNVDWRSHTSVSVCSYKVFAHIKTRGMGMQIEFRRGKVLWIFDDTVPANRWRLQL